VFWLIFHRPYSTVISSWIAQVVRLFVLALAVL